MADYLNKMITRINDLAGELTDHTGGFGLSKEDDGLYHVFYHVFRSEDPDNPYYVTQGLSEDEARKFLQSLIFIYGFEHGGLAELVLEV